MPGRTPSARSESSPPSVAGPALRPDPAKVLCVGLNYADHVAETGRDLPSYPDVFVKFASSLIGPNDAIVLSGITAKLDYEGELAIVIGKPARHVAEERALDHVAGVMVANDSSARDLQYNGTQWTAGKAIDSSTPCGPALVTLDELPELGALTLVTRVNGVEVQASGTDRMIFPIPRIVAYVSTFLQLNPGDVILTGTPRGHRQQAHPSLLPLGRRRRRGRDQPRRIPPQRDPLAAARHQR